MTKRIKKLVFNMLYIAVAVALILSVWAICAKAAESPFVMPTIADTFKALGAVVKLKSFRAAILGTLVRSFVGYAVAVAIAFALFFLCSVSNAAARIFSPIVAALRTLPTIAVSLVLGIWAGANAAPVILGVLVIAPSLFSTLRARVATLDKELIEAARLFGAGNMRIFRSVVMPTAAGALPEGLASGLSFNIKIVIAAEIVMQTANSLGMLMSAAQMYYMTAELIALVVLSVIVSVALEYAMRAILTVALKPYED